MPKLGYRRSAEDLWPSAAANLQLKQGNKALPRQSARELALENTGWRRA